MNAKKTAKNDGQDENLAMKCIKCGTERKPLKVMGVGRPRLAFECKCGITDRMGKKLV